MLKILVLTLGLVAQFSYAKEPIPSAWINAYHKTLTINGEYSYPLVRLQRKRARPVVLLHGLGGNPHHFIDLGTNLYKRGYDVWAFRWTSVNRSLDESGAQTVEELIDIVNRVTKKKVILVGHSLGGMVSKISLYGARKLPSGKWGIDHKSKERMAKRVLGFISIASPNGLGLSASDPIIKFLNFVPDYEIPLIRNLSHIINEGDVEKEMLSLEMMRFFRLTFGNLATNFFTKGLINLRNYERDSYSLSRIMKYGFSPLSKKAKAQFEHWINIEQITSIDEELDYTRIFFQEKNPVPFAYVAAGDDNIAFGEYVIDEAMKHNSPFLFLPRSGHLDTIIGKKVSKVGNFIDKFIKKISRK